LTANRRDQIDEGHLSPAAHPDLVLLASHDHAASAPLRRSFELCLDPVSRRADPTLRILGRRKAVSGAETFESLNRGAQLRRVDALQHAFCGFVLRRRCVLECGDGREQRK